jgi:TonB family protein
MDIVDGIECYVVRTGTREIFYRKSDLATVVERVDRIVVRRDTPPREGYSWPLFIGKSWEQTYTNERPADRQTSTYVKVWSVEQEGTVTVPAGTFRTLKIVERLKTTNTTTYEMWYAPAVNQWVKIREFLTTGVRERELIAFRVAHPGAWTMSKGELPDPARTAVIPLDTAEPLYQDYFNHLRRQIKGKWTYPREATEQRLTGQLLIEFRIANDGQLAYLELRRSSGVAILDEHALNAIRSAAPFPPVPDHIAKTVLAINARFKYEISPPTAEPTR